MAFSDLCHIANAYQTVENDSEAENIMDESFVRDLIVNLLEEGPSSDTSSIPPDNTINTPNQYQNDTGTSLLPPYNQPNPLSNFNFSPNNQNGFNYMQHFGIEFGNYEDNVSALLGIDMPDTTETVSPEQLNLLRLAAQEIGGAQFQSPNQNGPNGYNFFEPNQRNSLPETNMYQNNFNRPTSLNLDQNFNNFDGSFNHFNNKENQDLSETLSYLTQLNMSLERREDNINNIDFSKPPDMNFQKDLKALDERNKMNQFFNRNFQPNRSENHYFDNIMPHDRPGQNQMNFDFTNPPSNFKPNGFHQEFMQRREPMQNYNEHRNGFDNNRDMSQMALMKQQELARQMTMFMRNRPPPNQLNVDVSYLHDNNHFNLGLGALLGPSPHGHHMPPSPSIDIPLLAPFYVMRNIRNVATSSGILHARLDACYEQWRQLERERKRTEAQLALSYPGRAVSSSNSIPVPRLPPCPTRVDRLTVDMLREHTKVLTLMGKMETLRASVCAAHLKRKPDESKITVLRRGQDNVPEPRDADTFEPASWRDEMKNMTDVAPHKEVESAMLCWRSAVAQVQTARKREMHPAAHNPRSSLNDPILQLAEAVKHLGETARRARCAMWCDLAVTVALAPDVPVVQPDGKTPAVQATPVTQVTPENTASAQPAASTTTPATETKEEKPTTESPVAAGTAAPTAASASTAASTAAPTTAASATAETQKPVKLTDKEKRDRRTQNYKKHLHRNDFFRNQTRYDTRFMGRHPFHYLATGQLG